MGDDTAAHRRLGQDELPVTVPVHRHELRSRRPSPNLDVYLGAGRFQHIDRSSLGLAIARLYVVLERLARLTASAAATPCSEADGRCCFSCSAAGVIDGSPRLLSGSYTSLKTTNTPAACIAACAAGGFSYAGTQNGDRASILAPPAAAREAHLLTERFVPPPARAECYCGSTLNASGRIGTTAADSYCQAAACPGDASQKCGGPFYMRLFKSSPVAASTSSSAPIASSTAAAVPPGWQLKGCTFD
jgi:hypothetical protein